MGVVNLHLFVPGNLEPQSEYFQLFRNSVYITTATAQNCHGISITRFHSPPGVEWRYGGIDSFLVGPMCFLPLGSSASGDCDLITSGEMKPSPRPPLTAPFFL